MKSLTAGVTFQLPVGGDVGSNARAPTRETVPCTDPRNGFLLCRYPHGVLRRSLHRVVRCQPAHGGYDVLGGTSPCSRCPSMVWRHCLRGGKVRTGFSSVLGWEIKGCSGTVNFDPLCGFWGSFCNEQIQRQLTEPPRVPSLQCMVFWLHFSSMHQGEERARIPVEFRARSFKPVTGWRQ